VDGVDLGGRPNVTMSLPGLGLAAPGSGAVNATKNP
jgi:hypothetical protein